MLQLKTSSSPDSNLLNSWGKLWQSSSNAHPFNSPQWFSACLSTYEYKNYFITSVYEGDCLVGILPLVKKQKFCISYYCCPGEKHLDKASLLLADGHSGLLNTIVNKLTTVSAFCLQELPENVFNNISDDVWYTQSSENPYIPLQPNPFLYMVKRQRRAIVAKLKKYEKLLTYKCFKGSLTALKTAYEIDGKSAKKASGKPTFANKEDKKFYIELLKEYRKNFVVDILYFNKKPVNFYIGLTHKKTYHAYNTSYDAQYRHLTPGKLLAFLILERLHSEGMQTLDFSRGVTRMKRDFTKLSKLQCSIFFSKNKKVKLLWRVVTQTRKNITENELFYGTYLSFKKFLY
ncbi:MAG: GNAT family N-acetyltransferase [Patescibacteria group bacterium]|jgi:CelD/BcsL family acetyltransferase involved in cellulose biosynthesis